MEWFLPGLASVPNSHPMFVHFPIAFWFGALLFCGLGMLRPQSGLFRAGSWMLHLGTLSGVVAVVSGYLATATMDHAAPGHDLVHIHRNFMIVAAAVSTVTSGVMLALRNRSGRRPRFVQLALLALLAGVATLGADRGAMLVFGYGMGVRAEPPTSATPHDHGDPSPGGHTHK